MKTAKNILVSGSNDRSMAVDIFFEEEGGEQPVVVYAHGFNGFKDWANFDLVAKKFVAAGFVFVKFNFSHNGTTPEQPEDFADLEAFGNNNYTKQLFDLTKVIDWVLDPANMYSSKIDKSGVAVIGHSMGGGIAIIQAAEDARVTQLVCWASVSECKTPWGNWPEEKLRLWKKEGVQYYTNTRTMQQMPMYYQLHEDFVQHKERLNIKRSIESLHIPILICHGTSDIAVPVEKAYELKKWQPNAELYLLDTDHVFNRKHPWTEQALPREMEALVQRTIRFLRNTNNHVELYTEAD